MGEEEVRATKQVVMRSLDVPALHGLT